MTKYSSNHKIEKKEKSWYNETIKSLLPVSEIENFINVPKSIITSYGYVFPCI